MSKILHKLYNGKLIPFERQAPCSEEKRSILQKIEAEERYFIEKLSKEDCKKFQELSGLHTSLASCEEESIFSYGFTLGLLLMMDITEEAQCF